MVHVPELALLVHIEEAFIHCGKAPKRGRLWDPTAQIDRSVYPRMGEVMFDHGQVEDATGVGRPTSRRDPTESPRPNARSVRPAGNRHDLVTIANHNGNMAARLAESPLGGSWRSWNLDPANVP
jgi:hypothetical protein